MSRTEEQFVLVRTYPGPRGRWAEAPTTRDAALRRFRIASAARISGRPLYAPETGLRIAVMSAEQWKQVAK